MRRGRSPWRLLAAAAALVASIVVSDAAPAPAATGGGHLKVNTTSLSFHTQRVNTAWRAASDLQLTNDGDAVLRLGAMTLSGDLAGEFWVENRCPDVLGAGATCSVVVSRAPRGLGARAARLTIEHDGTNPPVEVSVWGQGSAGFYVATTTGRVYGYGDAAAPGQSSVSPPVKWETPFALNSGILDLESTPTGDGVWLVAGDGGIFTFGDAAFFGSTGDLRLNKPIVGMAATPTGRGYWLVASDGGIFTFGDAAFLGSTGAMRLNQPIVGMAATTSGGGYWLVASDGGIFTFGDAVFLGSTGNIRLNKPITAMARMPRSDGYWLVASDGGIFTFGDAPFHGSNPIDPYDNFGPRLRAVGMAVAPDATSYWIGYANSTVESFGSRSGVAGALTPPVIAAIAPTAPVAWWEDQRAHAALRQPPP
jgi:hypothetical protein